MKPPRKAHTGSNDLSKNLEVDAAAITLPNVPQSRHQALRLNTTRATKHRVNLFVANAAETPNILSRFPPKQWSMYYNIGYWIWELEEIPTAWIDQLSAFNEARGCESCGSVVLSLSEPILTSSLLIARCGPLPISQRDQSPHLHFIKKAIKL